MASGMMLGLMSIFFAPMAMSSAECIEMLMEAACATWSATPAVAGDGLSTALDIFFWGRPRSQRCTFEVEGRHGGISRPVGDWLKLHGMAGEHLATDDAAVRSWAWHATEEESGAVSFSFSLLGGRRSAPGRGLRRRARWILRGVRVWNDGSKTHVRVRSATLPDDVAAVVRPLLHDACTRRV